MAEIFGLGDVGLPEFSLGGFNTLTWLLIGVIILIVFIGAIGTFFIHRMKVYNKKIVVFENISGQGYQPVFKDRARVLRLGTGGEEVLRLLKKKIYRSAYGRKMGKNTYWFAVGQDGYWYNVVLGDVDAKMGMLDIEPIDRDMRYMHVAIRKNIMERYNKQSFMDRYGSYIMGGVLLIVLIIGGWFLLNKIGEISQASAGAVAVAQKVQETTAQVVSSLDNLCGGSGIQSVT